MARVESHFEFWPARVPRSLPLPETSVFDNLEVSARRYPEKAAIVYYGTEISYRRLLDEAERLAGYLQQELDVDKGDRVVLYAQNSPQFAVAFYAILRLGAVVVPVNPMLVAAELGHYVEDSGAKLAIAGQELYERLAGLLAGNGLNSIVVAAYSDYLEAETDLEIPDVVRAPREEIKDGGVVLWHVALSGGRAPSPAEVGADDVALLPYTSRTTGRPKGCVHTHRTLQATLVGISVYNTNTPAGVVLCVLPLFHVTRMQHSMNAPIFTGGTIGLMTRWDRRVAAELIERYGVTHWTNISVLVTNDKTAA